MRFLFVDRILQLIPGKSIQGIKQVTRDDPCLGLNEEGKPSFISSFIGETLGQLAAWNVMHTNGFTKRPVAGIVSSAQLHRAVFPGETLFLEASIDHLDDAAVEYHAKAWVGQEQVFTIKGALGPLLPMQDFIAQDMVQRQFAEIYRPGEFFATTLAELLPIQDFKPLHLSFDTIVEHTPGLSLTAEKSITSAAPWFADHFPFKPVLPMTVLLECKINLAREFIARSRFSRHFKLQELRKIKMNDFVQPGDRLRCTVQVKSQDEQQLILNFKSEVAGKRVCVLEMIMSTVL